VKSGKEKKSFSLGANDVNREEGEGPVDLQRKKKKKGSCFGEKKRPKKKRKRLTLTKRYLFSRKNNFLKGVGSRRGTKRKNQRRSSFT